MSKLNQIEALNLLGGSEKVYIALLNGFINRYAYVDKEIEQLIENGAFQEATILVHGIKGISGNLVAPGLYEKSRNLEITICRMVEEYKGALSLFGAELEAVIGEIKKILILDESNLEESERSKKSEKEVASLFSDLHKALNSFRYGDILRRMHAIESSALPEPLSEPFQEIKNYVADYSFMEAQNVILQMDFALKG